MTGVTSNAADRMPRPRNVAASAGTTGEPFWHVERKQIPRYVPAGHAASMLASTTTTKPPPNKKTISVLSFAPKCIPGDVTRRDEKAPRISGVRSCLVYSCELGIRIVSPAGVAHISPFGRLGDPALALGPAATVLEPPQEDCRCHWWCHWPGQPASSSGGRLSWIPSSRASAQVRPRTGGSIGIPDSLDTKQENTSGQAAVSCVSRARHPVVSCVDLSPSPVVPFLVCLCNSIRMTALSECRRSAVSLAIVGALTCVNIATGIDCENKLNRRESPEWVSEIYCVARVIELRLLCHRETGKPPTKPTSPKCRRYRKPPPFNARGPLCATPTPRLTPTAPPPRFAIAVGATTAPTPTPPTRPPPNTNGPPPTAKPDSNANAPPPNRPARTHKPPVPSRKDIAP